MSREVTEAHYLHERSGLEPVLRPPVKRPTALRWVPKREELIVGTKDGEIVSVDPVLGTRLVAEGLGEIAVIDVHQDKSRYIASSRDGRQFTSRVRVPTLGSPKPSHPQIAIDRDGRIAIAWDEALDGTRVAAVRELKPGGGAPAFGDVVRLAPDGAALYPVLAATEDGFVAVWTTGGGTSRILARRIALP